MRILITGATGLLGSDLCDRLSLRHEVIGWARRAPPAVEKPFVARCVWESVDLTDGPQVSSGILRHKPQVVIHSAAQSDVDACERDPAMARRIHPEATASLAQACAKAGAYLVAISTDYVFGGEDNRPYREEDPPHPVNAYGQSKWEAEQAALRGAGRCLVIRVSGLFGSARRNFVTGCVAQLKEGKTTPAATDQVNSPSYTCDVAQGIERVLSLAGGEPHGLLHLANEGRASRWDLAREIARHLHAPEALVQKVRWQELGHPARRPPFSQIDCSRYAQLTGAPLRSWQEALRAFLISQGLI